MLPGEDLLNDAKTGEERLLVDPDRFRSTGSSAHYAIDYYQASWNGKYVAYGISPGGSEESVLHVLDVDPGKDLSDLIGRTSESLVGWVTAARSSISGCRSWDRKIPLTWDSILELFAARCLNLFGPRILHRGRRGSVVVVASCVPVGADLAVRCFSKWWMARSRSSRRTSHLPPLTVTVLSLKDVQQHVSSYTSRA